MKHNFYANNRTQKSVDRQISAMKNAGFRSPVRSGGTPKKATGITDRIVGDKADKALEAYSDDPKIYSEITGKVSMYAVNLSIARQYKDKKSEKDLTREIVGYLDLKIKERR